MIRGGASVPPFLPAPSQTGKSPMIDTGDTRHLHIEFFVEPVENQAKSRTEGRPIFEDKEHVRIKFVGDPKKELVAPAHDKFTRDRATGEWVTYAQVYHRHYEAFKTGLAAKGEGTPISELPFLSEAKRAELRALHIHTAEALAGLEGTNLTRLGMYGRSLKDQAKAYIARAKDSALETRLAGENAELRARLAALEAQMRTPAPPPAAPNSEEESPSIFSGWDDAALKGFIKERTGAGPKGNPSHETLIRMAEEANAKEAA